MIDLARIRLSLPECDYCHDRVSPKQMMGFIWKRKRLKLNLCPSCFATLYRKHLKEVSIGKEVMVKSGYYKAGAREVDFKSFLEGWAKRQKQMR